MDLLGLHQDIWQNMKIRYSQLSLTSFNKNYIENDNVKI